MHIIFYKGSYSGNAVRSTTRSLWSSSATDSCKVSLLPRLVVLPHFLLKESLANACQFDTLHGHYGALQYKEIFLGKCGR